MFEVMDIRVVDNRGKSILNLYMEAIKKQGITEK